MKSVSASDYALAVLFALNAKVLIRMKSVYKASWCCAGRVGCFEYASGGTRERSERGFWQQRRGAERQQWCHRTDRQPGRPGCSAGAYLNARLRLQAELQQQVDSRRGGLELRGQLEQQTYQMEQSQERQRQLYQELDKVANSQPAATPATPAAGAATPAAAANYSTNQDENQAYDAAVNMVLRRRTTTRPFLPSKGSSSSSRTPAMFPMPTTGFGQLMFNKGDRAGAASQFSTVANKYSKSPKRADALLKLGMLAQLDGKKQRPGPSMSR